MEGTDDLALRLAFVSTECTSSGWDFPRFGSEERLYGCLLDFKCLSQI